MLSTECLATFKSRFEFSPTGEATGNLSIGRGRASFGAGRVPVPIFVAIVENKIASGSLGARECDKLASLFKVAAAKKSGLALYLDSAGARVSDGLPALGAFRYMYRAALDAAAAGVPMRAYCGANCFGGASMLAALAGTRVYSENTRFAMSGPSILAQAAGISALDDIFMAMSMAAINGEARSKLGETESMVSHGGTATLSTPAANALAARHAVLGARLPQAKLQDNFAGSEKLERKDLAKLYPEGYQLAERNGVLSGEATFEGNAVAVTGLIGGRLLGASRAWAQADALWKMLATPPRTLHVLVDCDSHGTSLDDERIMLSAYLADLACALHALAQAGTHIETTVLGKLGGGVYVALCAPVAQVNMLYGTEIQLLPGRAIASILGDSASQKHEFDEYKLARVADRELKLGIV
jgi:hypothetical protein